LSARSKGLAVTCAAAASVVLALVGPDVLLHPGRAIVGRNPSSDFQIMTWSLAWWPWAVGHGVDPLHTSLLWPPGGFSLLWLTSVPAPALLALPLTLSAGPLVAYNVLMLAAVVLAAGSAYLLCHELTGRAVPSALGGLVFGLSPYMLGHTLSEHLDLTFVFPVPLLALLAVRYVRGKTSPPRFVAGSAALLLILLGSSLELFLDLTLVLACVGALALAFARSPLRRALMRVARLLLLAYAVCLPVAAAVAAAALSTPHGQIHHVPSDYSVDLLNLVVPTPTLLTGGVHAARAVSGHFVGNIGERDGYLGLPLIVVALLALRAEWRRGAWVAGLVVAIAVLLSLGPAPTLDGRALFELPLSSSRIPLLGDALPARLSLFAALGAACLCAFWVARPGRPVLRLAVGALVAFSLVPNFSPPRVLPNAWPRTAFFAWSTPRAPRGFVDFSAWRRIVRRGANVLVLPTGDFTAAGYWQVEAAMRFALAVPATPFVPPSLASSPTVARVADNVLPQLDGVSIGAARLRTFLLAQHVNDVVVTRRAGRRWRELARTAAASRPAVLGKSLVFPVARGLRPLASIGELAVARPRVRAWVRYDGERGHVQALLAGRSRPTTLSSPLGDAEAPFAAAGARGRAAVAFTEWRDGEELVRVATTTGSGWQVATLDRSGLPIWSPRVEITSRGTVLTAWVDEVGTLRTLRVAALPAGGRWQRPIVLDHGDGLGSAAIGVAPLGVAVAAWQDSLASEARVRAAIYADGSWRPVVTLATSLGRLESVTVGRPNAESVRWRRWSPERTAFFEADRRGLGWGAARARER